MTETTRWAPDNPPIESDDPASQRLRRARGQSPGAELQHYPGREFYGPGNQKEQAEESKKDANGLGRSVKATSAVFQRTRAGDRFSDLGDAEARVAGAKNAAK
jgi:hypothetical protein